MMMIRPLNTVGMPYYKEQLLSSWPSHLVFEVGSPAPKIDSAILSTMTRTEIGFFAKNPKTKRRNQAEATRHVDRVSESLSAPKFLSEKARAPQSFAELDAKVSETMETLTDLHLDDVTRRDVPAMYGNVEIKYSKFGVDDFDFAYVPILMLLLHQLTNLLGITTRRLTQAWRRTSPILTPIHFCSSSGLRH